MKRVALIGVRLIVGDRDHILVLNLGNVCSLILYPETEIDMTTAGLQALVMNYILWLVCNMIVFVS